jgi:hypothetical protein
MVLVNLQTIALGCHLGCRFTETVAGMDGNRTHPGRLNSAPQTVLKTAGLESASVHQRPLEFGHYLGHSMDNRQRPRLCGKLAVMLAV